VADALQRKRWPDVAESTLLRNPRRGQFDDNHQLKLEGTDGPFQWPSWVAGLGFADARMMENKRADAWRAAGTNKSWSW